MNKKNLEDRNEITLLIDIYGDFLTEKQRTVLEMYFFEDFSLSEISKINDSSRQSILDSINRSVTQLKNFEEKLKILSKDRELGLKKKQILHKLRKFENQDLVSELYLLIKDL